MPLQAAETPASEPNGSPAHEPAYIVERRSEFCFAVLGPNPDAGKLGVSYSGSHLTICTTDGAEDAEMVAAALNARNAKSADVVPLRSPDESVSVTLAAFDARQDLAKRYPLVATAFHAAALVDGRCDVDVCDMALVAMIGEEAKRGLVAEGWDLRKMDQLYPLPRPRPMKPLLDMLARSARR